MMKQTAAPHALWLIPAVSFAAPNGRDRWRWPLIASFSTAVVTVAICLPFFRPDSWQQLLDAVISHNFEYTGAKLERAYYARLHVTHIDVTPFSNRALVDRRNSPSFR
jgi:hypothetical protein